MHYLEKHNHCSPSSNKKRETTKTTGRGASKVMSQERLTALIQDQREAMKTNLECCITRETIVSVLILLKKGIITQGRAQRLLRYQAVRLVDEPIQATLYRQAAAAIRQMQRVKQ